jgi:hypothetical protein
LRIVASAAGGTGADEVAAVGGTPRGNGGGQVSGKTGAAPGGMPFFLRLPPPEVGAVSALLMAVRINNKNRPKRHLCANLNSLLLLQKWPI